MGLGSETVDANLVYECDYFSLDVECIMWCGMILKKKKVQLDKFWKRFWKFPTYLAS